MCDYHLYNGHEMKAIETRHVKSSPLTRKGTYDFTCVTERYSSLLKINYLLRNSEFNLFNP